MNDSRARGSRFWVVWLILLIVVIVLVASQVIDMRVGQAEIAKSPAVNVDTRLFSVILEVMSACGAVGLALAALFFVRYSNCLNNAPLLGVSYSTLIRAFLVYLASNFFLGAIAAVTVMLSGLDSAPKVADLVHIILQMLAVLAACALGLGSLALMAGDSEDILQKIGMRTMPLKMALKWGVGTYLSALPFFGAAIVVSALLDKTVFKNISTPEHPLTPYFAGGDMASFLLVLALGMVIAPLVEEVFFRGVLYSALRGGMRVWGAAVVSAIVFAVGHPLPDFFLPIFVLGVVFALAREKTGSVVPSMIAHGIHNGVVIVFARLVL
ncbi:MAG: CPBP family intramembrane glutamic endopeptidase [Armatimonadota bacterium]|nr:CPBP family intramembrane metalloprotease [bacterium]